MLTNCTDYWVHPMLSPFRSCVFHLSGEWQCFSSLCSTRLYPFSWRYVTVWLLLWFKEYDSSIGNSLLLSLPESFNIDTESWSLTWYFCAWEYALGLAGSSLFSLQVCPECEHFWHWHLLKCNLNEPGRPCLVCCEKAWPASAHTLATVLLLG